MKQEEYTLSGSIRQCQCSATYHSRVLRVILSLGASIFNLFFAHCFFPLGYINITWAFLFLSLSTVVAVNYYYHALALIFVALLFLLILVSYPFFSDNDIYQSISQSTISIK